jgi:hypothetical protein
MIFADNSMQIPNAEVRRSTGLRSGVLLSPNTPVGSELFVREIKKTTLSKYPKLQDIHGAFIALAEMEMVSKRNGLEIFSRRIDQQATVRAMSENVDLLINGISGGIVEQSDPVYSEFLKAFSMECGSLEKQVSDIEVKKDIVGELMNIFEKTVKSKIIGAEDFHWNRVNINETIAEAIIDMDELGDPDYFEFLDKLKLLV